MNPTPETRYRQAKRSEWIYNALIALFVFQVIIWVNLGWSWLAGLYAIAMLGCIWEARSARQQRRFWDNYAKEPRDDPGLPARDD